MATPSAARPHSGSTPKHTSIATPTPMMPSPRPPTSSAMSRNLSHNLKSPATKTPASGHGHSHPSSTPLAAPSSGEDALNFNSPAAMMMSSLGSHGLTPLPSGPDGLGITTDLNAVSTGHGSVLGTRNPEEEKLRRLQEVVKLLRTKVVGRGICRDGVERLAQLAGFTHLWQGDTLAIAGTCVDLEITFDSVDKDRAKNVALKIFTPESEQHKTDAAAVLKSNLDHQSLYGRKEGPWRSLESFAANLEHLGRMDQLSQGINCFEAIDGLYYTFRKIWEGEKERIGRRRRLDRLSQGIIGRPMLNRKAKLGLRLEYWAKRRLLSDTEPSNSENDIMQHDAPQSSLDRDEFVWTACVDCEAGYPSLRVSREWIAENIWAEVRDEGRATDGTATPIVAWTEPPPTLVRPADTVHEPNSVDLGEAEIKIPKPPQVRFTANLEPPVLVPLSVASSVLNRQGVSVALEDSRFTTYDQALRNLMGRTPQSQDTGPLPTVQRWVKSVRTFGEDGQAMTHQHSYTLYSSPQIWCYPVQSVTFDHPKHLADLLPTLRQYVLLWSLLRSTVSMMSTSGTGAVDHAARDVASNWTSKTKGPSKNGIIKESNIDPGRGEVDALWRDRSTNALSRGIKMSSVLPGSEPTVPLPIDISLSLVSASPPTPKLELIWPLPTKPDASNSMPNATFGSVAIEIGPNGEIAVPSAAGIPFAERERGLRGIARVVGLGEDLTLVVEWILKRCKNTSAEATTKHSP